MGPIRMNSEGLEIQRGIELNLHNRMTGPEPAQSSEKGPPGR